MPSYVAYGLSLQSSLELPELKEFGDGNDIVLRIGRLDLPSYGLDFATTARLVTQEGAFLFYPDVGAFLVRRGGEIVVDPVPGVEPSLLRQYILGPALAVVLHQTGRLVLHASAVEVRGGVVAFLGAAGSGKSTAACALVRSGHMPVTDDIMGVDLAQVGHPTVSRGPASLKLWPEAMSVLGYDPSFAPRLHSRAEKRFLTVDQNSAQDPLPLSRIYVLAEGPVALAETLRQGEATVELIRHSYCARLLTAETAALNLRQCAALVKAIPVRRLTRPRDLSCLQDMTRVLMDDLAVDNRVGAESAFKGARTP